MLLLLLMSLLTQHSRVAAHNDRIILSDPVLFSRVSWTIASLFKVLTWLSYMGDSEAWISWDTGSVSAKNSMTLKLVLCLGAINDETSGRCGEMFVPHK